MIVSAAVKYYSILLDKEIIMPLHRHQDFSLILYELARYRYDHMHEIEGFLTDKGEFLDRREAADHAYECGQLVETAEEPRIDRLMSEDLW